MGIAPYTLCESCGFLTFTFLGTCTNAQCMKPKPEACGCTSKELVCDNHKRKEN